MKVVLVLTLFVTMAVISVFATSPPDCAAVTCDQATCAVFECQCGTYKDYCGCCDFCHKCPGEECTTLLDDPCTDGYRCSPDNPDEAFVTGDRGHCKPLNETSTEHQHQHHGHSEHNN